LPASILKRKSNVSRAIDTSSWHTLESTVNQDGTASMSIVKRAKPSTQALVPVSSQEMSTQNVYHPSRKEKIGDIETVHLPTISKSKKRPNQKQRKYPFGNTLIYDAQYKEMLDEVIGKLNSPKPEFSTVPASDARSLRMPEKRRSTSKKVSPSKQVDLGLNIDSTPEEIEERRRINKKRADLRKNGSSIGESYPVDERESEKLRRLAAERQSEPAGIRAISKRKQEIKNELLNFNPTKPSREHCTRNNNRNDSDWLIDAAFDKLVDVVKTAGKAGKVAGKVTGKVVRGGVQATKQGLREFNEISEIVCANPMLKNIEKHNQATLNSMSSARNHANNSILATGANRRYVTAGALVTRHGFGSHTNVSTIVPQVNTGLKVIPKVVRRGNRDVILYFLENGTQVTARQAELIRQGVLKIPQTIGASTPIANAYPTYNTNPFSLKKNTNHVINVPRVAQATNYINENIENSVGTVAKKGNVIGEITRKTTASGLVTKNKGGLVYNQGRGNPVLNVTKIASPSGLLTRNSPGMV
jgi:hypothetical protein